MLHLFLTATLLLTAPADGALTTEALTLEINIARIQNDVLPVRRDDRLDRAAELQVEWLAFAYKHHELFPSDHVCSSAWLLDRHPELDWAKLLATYGGILPEWLGSFDLARLCGYNGQVIDIGAYGGRKSDPVGGWLRSELHRQALLDPDFEDLGVAIGGSVGAGNFPKWAVFGVEQDQEAILP